MHVCIVAIIAHLTMHAWLSRMHIAIATYISSIVDVIIAAIAIAICMYNSSVWMDI